MTKFIKILLSAILFIAIGYAWAFFAYQPLEMEKRISQLEVQNRALSDGYTRQFSKKFLEVEK